eukprot:scaffold5788_cov95-Isochrysis_galbana.AAC.5
MHRPAEINCGAQCTSSRSPPATTLSLKSALRCECLTCAARGCAGRVVIACGQELHLKDKVSIWWYRSAWCTLLPVPIV